MRVSDVLHVGGDVALLFNGLVVPKVKKGSVVVVKKEKGQRGEEKGGLWKKRGSGTLHPFPVFLFHMRVHFPPFVFLWGLYDWRKPSCLARV